MSLIGMHTGPQIHATVPLKVSNALQRIYEIDSEIKFISFKAAHGRFPLDVRKGGVLGLTPPPLELDILQKLYYLRKGD